MTTATLYDTATSLPSVKIDIEGCFTLLSNLVSPSQNLTEYISFVQRNSIIGLEIGLGLGLGSISGYMILSATQNTHTHTHTHTLSLSLSLSLSFSLRLTVDGS